MKECDQYPLFLKPIVGSGSIGTLQINAVNDDMVALENHDEVSIRHLYDEMIAHYAYLIQSTTKNHATLAAITPYLATTRLYNFFDGDGLVSLYPLIKIPANSNIADNYWREGNLLASIDAETGKITRVITGTGLEQSEVTHHPDSNIALLGLEIPHWNAVKALNEQCARLFEPLHFVSTDIAITDDGPVVVEVNIGGSFTLPQMLYQTGFLSDERKAFFERHGVTL